MATDPVDGIMHEKSLSKNCVARYSRQIIMDDIGPDGQMQLQRTKVLIVGAGGLGCPCGQYLAAAGLGTIGYVDYDDVETSNLHRQILHRECTVGNNKTASAISNLQSLNSTTNYESHNVVLNSSNAMDILGNYHIIVDCTDNVATRYLLNDTCVLLDKPLVSGSALKWEGQLTVYHYKDGPCFRCLFPMPPPPETVVNCSDGGVLGVIPGIIGTLQALEVIKLALGISPSYAGKLFLFDGFSGVSKVIKLRQKKNTCAVCGATPTIDKLIDYQQFCGSTACDKTPNLNLLSSEESISVFDYQKQFENEADYLLLDVRESVETKICKIPAIKSMNIPFSKLRNMSNPELLGIVDINRPFKTLYVLCHKGNDSQRVVVSLTKILETDLQIKSITGGIKQYASSIDTEMPDY